MRSDVSGRALTIIAACAAPTPTPTAPPETNTAARAQVSAAPGDKAPPEGQAILDAHNRLRASHCAEPLVWSDALARGAKAWVDHLAAKGCMLQHSETQYGENISGGSASTQTSDQVASLWYSEKDAYHYGSGGFSMRTGHFTQVVWRGSRRLGCAAASCGDIRLWVCNYDPAGNMLGDFERNVLPPTCHH